MQSISRNVPAGFSGGLFAGFSASLFAAVLSGSAFAQGPAGNAGGSAELPFSGIYQRPAVSPYTMLGTPGFGQPTQGGGVGGAGSFNPLLYQQIIQPRLEQERQQTTLLKQNRQLGSLQNQVHSIQRDTRMRQIDSSIRPTGHASTFMNTSHYYGGGGGGGRGRR